MLADISRAEEGCERAYLEQSRGVNGHWSRGGVLAETPGAVIPGVGEGVSRDIWSVGGVLAEILGVERGCRWNHLGGC